MRALFLVPFLALAGCTSPPPPCPDCPVCDVCKVCPDCPESQVDATLEAVRAGSTDPTYDWNGDGAVGMDDVSIAIDAEKSCSDPADWESPVTAYDTDTSEVKPWQQDLSSP